MSVRATVSICCSPPERLPPRRPAISPSFGKYSKTRPTPQPPPPLAPTSRFSATVRSLKMRLSSGTQPMPSRLIS